MHIFLFFYTPRLAKTRFPHDIIGAVECRECRPDLEDTNIELKEHGIQIHIPHGAVGRKIEMEFAVCLSGPFKFPAKKRPVSPILWICAKEEIKKFKKPVKVTIPHIFPELLEHEIAELQLSFVKADHSTDFCTLDDGSKSYSFSEIKGSGSHFRGGYGTLNLDHCCYLCLSANNDAAIAGRAEYCLSQFHLTNGSRNVVIFCATYSLSTCLKVCYYQGIFICIYMCKLNSPLHSSAYMITVFIIHVYIGSTQPISSKLCSNTLSS